MTGTAGTDLEGSEAGTADEVVGTPGWKAASGAAELEHEQAERAEEAHGAGESGPAGPVRHQRAGGPGRGQRRPPARRLGLTTARRLDQMV